MFFDYARSLTWYMAILILLFNVLSNGLSVGSNFWLSAWSDREDSKANISEAETYVWDGKELHWTCIVGSGVACIICIYMILHCVFCESTQFIRMRIGIPACPKCLWGRGFLYVSNAWLRYNVKVVTKYCSNHVSSVIHSSLSQW